MDWVTCAYSAACTGVAHQPSGHCLAHLPPDDLAAALAGMAPGRLLDLRGTVLTGDLLARVLEAAGHRPGRTRLDRARFTGDVRLAGVTFAGDVSLDGARFDRLASFFGARFERNVSLAGAVFARELSFHGVRARGHVSLERAVMSRDALFGQAVLERGLSCERARFDGYATFDGARIGDGAAFRGARFGRTLSFRKVTGSAGFDGAHFAADAYLSATGRLSLVRARADGLLDMTVAGCGVDLRRTEVAGATTLRLTDSYADLEGAVLRGPATVTGRGRSRVTSLRGVDAPSLALSGLDLSACRFAGLAHPSGVRVKDCTFALTPRGLRVSVRRPMVRWFSRRSALADERTLLTGDPQDGPWATPGGLADLYAELRGRVDDRGTSDDFAFAALEMRRQAAGRRWTIMPWLSASSLASSLVLSLVLSLVSSRAASLVSSRRTGRFAAWFALLAAVTAGAVLWTSASHAERRAGTHVPSVHG